MSLVADMERKGTSTHTFTSLAAATAALLRTLRPENPERDDERRDYCGSDCGTGESRRAVPAELNKRMTAEAVTKLTGEGRRTAGEEL